jgi:hypothetical protein
MIDSGNGEIHEGGDMSQVGFQLPDCTKAQIFGQVVQDIELTAGFGPARLMRMLAPMNKDVDAAPVIVLYVVIRLIKVANDEIELSDHSWVSTSSMNYSSMMIASVSRETRSSRGVLL